MGEIIVPNEAKQQAALANVKNLLQALAKEPSEDETKINKYADNAKFIPIQIIEDKLDYFFNGLWQTENFKYQVVVNELIGSIDLLYMHPVTGMWIRRAGTGSVIIQQRAEYEMIDGKRVKKPTDVLDVSRKIANTLVKDMGHLKAECIKNAAKSIGRTFGSSLNRNSDDGFLSPGTTTSFEQFEAEVEQIETEKELNDYYLELPKVMKRDARVTAIFKTKKIDIQQNGTVNQTTN